MELNFEEIGRRTGRSSEEVARYVEQAKRSMIPLGRQVGVVEGGQTQWFIVTRRGVGIILTDYGRFHQFDFNVGDQWGKYSVLFYGEVTDDFAPVFRNPELLLMRIDSGCETGQVFGDRTCECREQLKLVMKTIAARGEGVIINIPFQDGRGLRLPFKLATLRLQAQLRLNTVEAAHAIAPNGVIDIRTYGGVIGILKFFEIPTTMQINLATNNPHKAGVFAENGYTVSDFTPVVIPPTEHTKEHLQAKQNHLGHIDLVPKPKEGDQHEDAAGAPPSSGGDEPQQ